MAEETALWLFKCNTSEHGLAITASVECLGPHDDRHQVPDADGKTIQDLGGMWGVYGRRPPWAQSSSQHRLGLESWSQSVDP